MKQLQSFECFLQRIVHFSKDFIIYGSVGKPPWPGYSDWKESPRTLTSNRSPICNAFKIRKWFTQIVRPAQLFFWSTYRGAEIDLFLLQQGRRYGAEFKFSEAPKITKSMRTALNDLDLEHLWVIYPGQHQYTVDKKVSVWPLQQLPDLATQLREFSKPAS